MSIDPQSLLSARINDAARLFCKTSSPRFVGFLTEDEVFFARGAARRAGVPFRLFGGFADAERQIMGVGREDIPDEDFPIVRLLISYRAEDKPTHRDVLGALMGLGVERDKIGDIFIDERAATVFVHSDIERAVISGLDKIGPFGVKVGRGEDVPLPARSFTELSDTIAGNRLDAVIAALAHTSRSAASEMISAGYVTVCGAPALKPTARLKNGDRISIRRKGKFIIDSTEDTTKKGRIVLRYRKYN